MVRRNRENRQPSKWLLESDTSNGPQLPVRECLRDRSGQTTVEYILMLVVITGLFIGVTKMLDELNIAETLSSPLKKDFKAAYQFGHPKAKGYDEGPELHPRYIGGNNFRIFIEKGK